MKTLFRQTILLATLGLFMATSLPAQNYLSDPKYGVDEDARKECAMNLNLYRDEFNRKNYDGAKPYWQKVLSICPASSQNTYIHGVRMLKIWIGQEKNPNRRTELIDSLMMIYDMRIENFKREGVLLGQKGMDMASLDSDRYEEAYAFVKRSVEIEGEKSNPPVLFTLMALSKTMYDNNKVQAEDVIETYALIADYIDIQMKLEGGSKGAVLLQVKENVDAIFAGAGVANCENLTQIFESRVNESPEDVELLKKTYNLLGANSCKGTDFYRSVAAKLYVQDPSAGLAYELAKLYDGIEDLNKTQTYFTQAIELEPDSINKSAYLLEYASVVFQKLKRSQEARSLALQALGYNPQLGHAYMLIGNIYASEKNCFGDDFRNKTVYWAAVDKFIRAKQVTPALQSDCDRLIEAYVNYFPAQNDIFFQDLNLGDSYTVGGWINEVTTIRKRP